YQGAVRQIPRSMYEAAQLDGAGRVRTFFRITLPQLKYTIITSSTLMVVGSLVFFDLIFVLTAGGPGDATRVLALEMYKRGFQANLMGQASVIAVILVLLGLGLALLLRRIGGGSSRRSQLEGVWGGDDGGRRDPSGRGGPEAPVARPRRAPPQLAGRCGGMALAPDRDRAHLLERDHQLQDPEQLLPDEPVRAAHRADPGQLQARHRERLHPLLRQQRHRHPGRGRAR